MDRGKIVSADEAVALIRSGDTIATSGFGGIGFAEEIGIALEVKLDLNLKLKLKLHHRVAADFAVHGKPAGSGGISANCAHFSWDAELLLVRQGSGRCRSAGSDAAAGGTAGPTTLCSMTSVGGKALLGMNFPVPRYEFPAAP